MNVVSYNMHNNGRNIRTIMIACYLVFTGAGAYVLTVVSKGSIARR